ncbi:carbohydrate ABC transporter permease [Vibrio cholerae]
MLGKRSLAANLILAIAILSIVIFSIFPFVQIVSTSFKHQFDWGNPSLIPTKINTDAYKDLVGLTPPEEIEVPTSVQRLLDNPALSEVQRDKILAKYTSNESVFPFGKFMLNSFLISSGAALVALFLAVMGAYALSRLKFRGQTPIQRGVLFVYMVGGVLLMVPLYQMSMSLGLAQTTWGSLLSLALIYIMQTLPVALYMLGNYFRSIPGALEEAAMMDGYTRVQAIYKVILPLSMPMLATVFIYCFIIGWNEYLFASVFLKQTPDLHTLPLALQELFVSKNAIWDRIMAASTLTLLPVIACFMFAMKHMTGGQTDGGVKG